MGSPKTSSSTGRVPIPANASNAPPPAAGNNTRLLFLRNLQQHSKFDLSDEIAKESRNDPRRASNAESRARMAEIKASFQSNLEKRQILKFRFPGPEPTNVRSPMAKATDSTGQAMPMSKKNAGNRVSWAPAEKLTQERAYRVPANTKRIELVANLDAVLQVLVTTSSTSTTPKGLPASTGNTSLPLNKEKLAQLEADVLLALDNVQADMETTELDKALKVLEDLVEQPVAARGSTNTAPPLINDDQGDLDAELDALEAMLPPRQESLEQKIDQLLAPLVGHNSKHHTIAAKESRPSTNTDDLKEIDDLIKELEAKPNSSKQQAAPAKTSPIAWVDTEDDWPIHPDVEVARAEVSSILARHHNIFKGEKIRIKDAAIFANELSNALTSGHVLGAHLIAGDMSTYVAKAKSKHQNLVPAAEIKEKLDSILKKLQ